MKKIYCYLTWAALTVALTACGNNQQSAEPVKENKAAVVEAPTGQAEQAPPAAVQESVPPADQALPAEQGAPATAPHN